MPSSLDRFLAIPEAALERAALPQHDRKEMGLVVQSGVRADEEAIMVGYSVSAGIRPQERIAFQLSLVVPHLETVQPKLSRAIEISFAQHHPPRMEPNHTLSAGSYEIDMFDVHLGERVNGEVVFGRRNNPSLMISADFMGSYSTELEPSEGAFGSGGMQVYDARQVAIPEKQILMNSRAVDVVAIGGLRRVVEGLDPHPRYSDLIKASMSAALEYANHVRAMMESGNSGPDRFTAVSKFSGPFGEPTNNLLDVFTPRLDV